MELKNIPIGEIIADHEFNCRGEMSAPDVIDLVKDIPAQGLIQPLTVGPYDTKLGGYLLIAGYRRHYALRVLGWKEIPCVVRLDMGDEIKARVFNLCENLQRKNLDIMQEANALKHLYNLGLSTKDTAEQVNKPTGWVEVRFKLLDLPTDVQQEVLIGKITQKNIRNLHKIYKNVGVEGVHEAVKKIKESNFRSERINLNAHMKKVDERLLKKVRQRTEIFDMVEHLVDTVGPGVATRALAWASGEICSQELYVDIKEEMEKRGETYVTPKI